MTNLSAAGAAAGVAADGAGASAFLSAGGEQAARARATAPALSQRTRRACGRTVE